MPPEKDFDNKRVIIVGGSSGIGLAVAEQVALPNTGVRRFAREALSFSRPESPAGGRSVDG